jgi:hypothetical protein
LGSASCSFSARLGCPEAIDECPNENGISVAFAIEWNSGVYSGDPAVFFVLSMIIDEVILFAAVHESVVGTSRHFAAPRKLVAIGEQRTLTSRRPAESSAREVRPQHRHIDGLNGRP